MRSFGLVDHKMAEAEFFLIKIPACGFNFFDVRCYVSAFISSMRSVTFSIQASLRGIEGFDDWYKQSQARLRKDSLARFFNEFRRVNQHIGDNLIKRGETNQGNMLCFFVPTSDIRQVPQEDVATACKNYFVTILSIVYECYIQFGPNIDAQQRYTADYFEKIGKTVEDAEEEVGLQRGWTDIGDPTTTPYRWQSLRDRVGGCEINPLFRKYLNRSTPSPERLPDFRL